MTHRESSSPNPVYDRLTRGIRRPSRRGMAILRASACLVGLANGVMAVIGMRYVLDLVPFEILGLGGLAAVALLPASLIAGATITARYARREDFAMLRLTSLTGQQIGKGYIEGVFYRLRLVGEIALWYLAGIELGGALIANGPMFSSPNIFPSVFGLLYTSFSLSPLLFMFLVCLAFVSRSSVVVGVWIGLRWASRATFLASAGAAGAIVFGVAMLLVVTLGAPLILLVLLPSAALLSLIAARPVENLALRDMARFVDGQSNGRIPIEAIAQED